MRLARLSGTVALGFTLAAGCASSPPPPPQASVRSAASPDPASAALRANEPESQQAALARAMLLLQRVHFGLDSFTLGEPSRRSLDAAAEILRKHPNVEVYVEGHADNRGTNEYNLALSDRRAQVVIEYLSRLGVPAERMAPIAKGELAPLVDGTTAEAYAANRRVEFRLRRGDAELVLETGALLDDQGRVL